MAGCNPGTTDEDLRKALLTFIADFANWDHATHGVYLNVSRALVKAAHGEEPPLVVDPFAGALVHGATRQGWSKGSDDAVMS